MRKIYGLVIFIMVCFPVLADSNFSFYDWYEEYTLIDAAAAGMGGTSVAWRQNNHSLLNPAHVGKMESVMLSLSFSAMKLYSETDIYDFEDEYGYFPNMQFGCRLLGKVPFVFGYAQHYNTAMESEWEEAGADYSELTTLKGGLNSIFWGSGYEWGDLAVGAVQHWYFGRKSKENERDYSDSQFHDSRVEKAYRYWGIGFDLGANYRWRNLNLGAAVSLPLALDGTYKRKSLGETIYSEDISVEFPKQYRAGFSYVMGNNVFAGDVSYALWEEYKLGDAENHYQNTYRISAGWEKMMKVKELLFLNRVALRMGGYYQTLSLQEVGGDGLAEYGVSLGMSVPFVRKMTNLVNFSATYGARGPYGATDLKETFIRFSVNINFFDQWEKAKDPEEDVQIHEADPRYLKEGF